MQIKLIPHGLLPKWFWPKRAHPNDAGADVFAITDIHVEPHSAVAVPLGFGLEVPPGYMACIFPRSSQAKANVDVKLPPIDPGYTGEVHAIITNGNDYPVGYGTGVRIGQLVVLPCVQPDFVMQVDTSRAQGAFGSTGGMIYG